jgi:hypothetical protein
MLVEIDPARRRIERVIGMRQDRRKRRRARQPAEHQPTRRLEAAAGPMTPMYHCISLKPRHLPQTSLAAWDFASFETRRRD